MSHTGRKTAASQNVTQNKDEIVTTKSGRVRKTRLSSSVVCYQFIICYEIEDIMYNSNVIVIDVYLHVHSDRIS